MATHDSAACCETPVPASTPSYTRQGSERTISGTTCYVTGPATSTRAICFVYDVFGFQPPTFRGADTLARDLDCLVVMPDFFDGEYAQIAWLKDMQDPENRAAFNAWRGAHIADAAPHVQRAKKIMQGVVEEGVGKEVTSWGGIGYCWGGKIVSITSGAEPLWKASVQSSPALISTEDAEKVTVPMMVLASSGEDAEAVKAYVNALKVPHVAETFGDQVHGWMSARADLADPKVVAAYEKGYKLAVDFFNQHL